jgi:hypothetical protein
MAANVALARKTGGGRSGDGDLRRSGPAPVEDDATHAGGNDDDRGRHRDSVTAAPPPHLGQPYEGFERLWLADRIVDQVSDGAV